MTVSEEARLEKFKRFEEVLGMPTAATLMDHLPHGGAQHVATKDDLALLEARLEARIDRSARSIMVTMFGMFAAFTTLNVALTTALIS